MHQPVTLRAGLLAIALTLGILGAATPAAALSAAAPIPAPLLSSTAQTAAMTLAITGPATTEQLWVELEHPGIRANTVRLEYLPPQQTGWQPLSLAETAFGLTAIVPAEPGPYLFRVTTPDLGTTDLVITAATGTGTVLATARERLTEIPAPEPGGGKVDPQPSGTDESTDPATTAGNSHPGGALSGTGASGTVWALAAALLLGAGAVLGVRTTRKRIAGVRETGTGLTVGIEGSAAEQVTVSLGEAPAER